VKIAKVDAELRTFKEQMGKMKEGPGKVSPRRLTLLLAEYRLMTAESRPE